MDAKKAGGPDMMKMLHMMLPYMDSSTKRMLSIMIKLQELQELMKVEEEAKPKASEREENQTSSAEEKENKEAEIVWPAAVTAPDHNLALKLREGLTPEQQSMITSLTDMLG